MNEISFMATVWRIATDSEGESKVTFTVPLSDLGQVVQLSGRTQQLLMVRVTTEDKPGEQ